MHAWNSIIYILTIQHQIQHQVQHLLLLNVLSYVQRRPTQTHTYPPGHAPPVHPNAPAALPQPPAFLALPPSTSIIPNVSYLHSALPNSTQMQYRLGVRHVLPLVSHAHQLKHVLAAYIISYTIIHAYLLCNAPVATMRRYPI